MPGNTTQPIFHQLAFGAWVGGNVDFRYDVGGNANYSDLRYQHLGITNGKLWHFGSKSTQGPNTNGFASQWNIGLALHCMCVFSHSRVYTVKSTGTKGDKVTSLLTMEKGE